MAGARGDHGVDADFADRFAHRLDQLQREVGMAVGEEFLCERGQAPLDRRSSAPIGRAGPRIGEARVLQRLQVLADGGLG